MRQFWLKWVLYVNSLCSHLYLPLHRYAEERDEVHDEDGPKDGDVKELEEGAEKRDQGRLRCRVPRE